MQQPYHRKHQLEIRRAMQSPPGGRAFLILKAVVDVTERAAVVALDQRWIRFPVSFRQFKWQQFGKA
jgi:hypothetical protein